MPKEDKKVEAEDKPASGDPKPAPAKEDKKVEAEDKPANGDPKPAPAKAAPVVPASKGGQYIWGTGRRKSAVARVRIRQGTGNMLINKRPSDEYFTSQRDRQSIVAPLESTETVGEWDVWANVRGGGPTGQAGAVMLGLARALVKADPEAIGALKKQGLLTRDPRMSERKKPGQPGARKKFQFSKR